jgi:hypothetical protein
MHLHSQQYLSFHYQIGLIDKNQLEDKKVEKKMLTEDSEKALEAKMTLKEAEEAERKR